MNKAHTNAELPMGKVRQSQKLDPKTVWICRGRSVGNLLRMGHCAPTVMQTILDVSGLDEQWLVKLSAGMPGGIGNTGFECGAMTSPLVLLGLHNGLREVDRGLPVIFDKGHALCQQFLACHKTIHCKQIRGKDHFPKHCIRPVCLAPELYMAASINHSRDAIAFNVRDAYCRLYSHFSKSHFHCAHAVLHQLHYKTSNHQRLFDATSAFLGGTLFLGMTCSAFAAGVMAVGLQSGEIENSPQKVIRLLTRMTLGGNAFDEKINKFNRSMNTGYRMSKWFTQEFGSTQCRAITQCDFSTHPGVNNFIERDCVTRCKEMAAKVAEKVQETITDLKAVQISPDQIAT